MSQSWGYSGSWDLGLGEAGSRHSSPNSHFLTLPAAFWKEMGLTEWAGMRGDVGRTVSPGDSRGIVHTSCTLRKALLRTSTWEGGANTGALGPATDLLQIHMAPRAPWHGLAPSWLVSSWGQKPSVFQRCLAQSWTPSK